MELSKKYNKSAVQIVLRWAIQRGLAVIPKSTKEERIKENADIINFKLEKEDIEKLTNLDKGRRYNNTLYYQ